MANTGQSFFIGIAHFILTATGVDQILSQFPADPGNDIRWLEGRGLNACGGSPCTGSGVTVAVIDSGVDQSHPDLAGQISPRSISFDASDPGLEDFDGHGTFIAGLVAARSGNGVGMVGVAPDAQVLAIKDDLTSDTLARSIRYAVEHGASIINISEGGSQADDIELAAINYAVQSPYRAIIVASAGNEARSGNPVEYPASFSGVVSVGSTDPDGMHSLFSETNDLVDISAPGGFITSLKASRSLATTDCAGTGTPYMYPELGFTISYRGVLDCVFTAGGASNGYYTIESGTSFSAPIVAASAALAKQKWPDLTSSDFDQLLRETARLAPDQTTPDSFYGAGVLDLQQMLSYNFAPELLPGNVALTNAVVTNSGADTTEIIARVVDLDGPADIESVGASALNLGWVDLPLAVANDGTLTSGTLAIPATIAPNQYPITITARDKAGHQISTSLTLAVTAVGAPPPSGFTGSSTDVAVTISKPARRRELLTRKKSIAVTGNTAVGAAFVEVNDAPADLDVGRHVWSGKVSLDEGDNDIEVKSLDVTRTVSATATVTVTRDTKAPAPVRDLRAESNNGATKLTWTAPGDRDIAGYHVYRMEGGKPVEVAGTGKTTATVDGAAGPFRVTAEDKAGNEGPIDKAASTQGAGGPVTFSDVPSTHFAASAIATLGSRGIVSGQNGMFRPDAPVSRAEFAKMLAGARGIHAGQASSRFADVPLSNPLAPFIEAIASRGWAKGDGENYYPAGLVMRIEAAAMIARAMGYQGGHATFRDVSGSEDARVAAAVADARIANGQGGYFYPRRALTRGEAAKMLAAIL